MRNGKVESRVQVHPFPPVCGPGARLLVLGTFPSVKSRETGFYYGHAQNRFWRVLAAVYEKDVPGTNGEKQALLESCGVALWDVLASCRIAGSADASIREAVPNDVAALLERTGITRVFTNGAAAHALYQRHAYPKTGIKDVPLPSTSPANAAFSLERLTALWRQALLFGEEGQVHD